jgi:hypothetical protein
VTYRLTVDHSHISESLETGFFLLRLVLSSFFLAMIALSRLETFRLVPTTTCNHISDGRRHELSLGPDMIHNWFISLFSKTESREVERMIFKVL